MATVYSRTWKSGKVSWYTKTKDARGEWKPLLLKGVKSGPQAKKLAAEIEKEHERAGHGLAAASPFAGSFADLCAWAWKTHFSKQGSARPDGSRLRKHAGDPEAGTATWLGALPVRRVTGARFAQYFAEIAEIDTVRGKPPATKSINRLRALFSTVFELAKEHGFWIGPNPIHDTKARPEVKASFDILEAHEVGPTLGACDPYWTGCLAVGIFAALRKGEIFGLEKRDVDLARRILMVRRSHGRDTTKGGTHAAVPIHEALVPYLEEWLQTPGGMLFPSHDGKRRSHHVNLPRILRIAMVRAGFIDRWEYVCRRSGCSFRDELPQAEATEKRDCPECGFRLWATPRARNIRWHEGTRHTLASHALMSGASLQGVQKILRHQSPQLTIQTYGHLSAGFLGAEVNRMNLPGLPKRADAVPALPEGVQNGEPDSSEVQPPPSRRGAPMVRGAKLGAPGGERKVMNQHQNGFESEWSRRELNSRPMHCESKATRSADFGAVRQASQTFGTASASTNPVSHGSPPVGSRSAGRGAPMVRGKPSTHHGLDTAKATGPGRDDLLTVRAVARRLSMSVGWVYRRIEKGELHGGRPGPGEPVMVSPEALRDYLRRFPGIEAPALPAPAAEPAAPVQRARKGAA